MNYILDDNHVPVHESDIHAWGRWFEEAARSDRRHVARTTVVDADVSTVFLGIDHNFWGGPPLLFETMIFGGEYDNFQKRYHTWQEALASHDQIVAALRDGRSPE